MTDQDDHTQHTDSVEDPVTSGRTQGFSRRVRWGLLALAAALLVVGAIALMMRAPIGTIEWLTRLISLVGLPLGYLVLFVVLGRVFFRDEARRTTALYSGLVGVAILVAFRQITAPVFLDIESYQPNAAGYEFIRDAELEDFATAQWARTSDVEPDRVRLFVASDESGEIGLVVAVDMETTDLSNDDVRARASEFTAGLTAAGATEADPIDAGGEQVLVYEAQGEPLAFWLHGNLFLFATADTSDLELLVIALHQAD